MPDNDIDVGDDIILPTTDFPTVTPISDEDDDVFWDNKEMEEKLDEYKIAANGTGEDTDEPNGAIELHAAWVEALNDWSRRFDDINSRMRAIEEMDIITIDATPGDGYEEFEIFGLPAWITATFSILSSLYGMYSAYSAYKGAGTVTNIADQIQKIRKGAKWSGAAAFLTLVAGVALILAERVHRGKFLKKELKKFDDWLSDAESDIENIRIAIEGDGTVDENGQVNGIIPFIRELAKSVGQDNTDNNIMYRNLVNYLNTVLADAGELKGRLQVTNRMICIDNGKSPYTPDEYEYSNATIAQLTGVTQSIVENRRTALSADNWGQNADPPRNTCDGFV